MRIASLDIHTYPVPFRLVFRHASAQRAKAENIIVSARSACGATGFGEGCPRPYVTGETVATATRFVSRHRAGLVATVGSVDDLRGWLDRNHDDIDRNPAAFCAVELAILDLHGKLAGCTVEESLGLPRQSGTYQYTAILGDTPLPVYCLHYLRYRAAGFRDFKIKASGDIRRDRRKLAVFARNAGSLRVRIDLNNLGADADATARYVTALGGRLFAVEEPLRAGDLAGFRQVAEATGARIILDESLLRAEQIAKLGDPQLWILNLRVSKLGGLIRALALAGQAAERGFGLILGAQVGETSLLTRAGLVVISAHRASFLAAEGAFGTRLLRDDLTTCCLMFGQGGVLAAADYPALQRPGLGLTVRASQLTSPQDCARFRDTAHPW